MKETIYIITKMDCPTEEQIIRNRLRSVKEVESIDFDLMNRKLTVKHHLDDPKTLQSALESVGMDPVPADEYNGDGSFADHHHDHEDHDHAHGAMEWLKNERLMLGVSGVFAALSEGVAFASKSEHSIPVIALALLSIAFGGRTTLKKGWIALKTRTLNINFLMTLAVIGALAIGQWPEAAMVTFLFALAETIEAYSLDRARNAIKSLMALSPDTAQVRQADGSFTEVAAGDVTVGQVVRVKPGERIALDGRLTSGSSNVNQAPITGESMPVSKAVGDTVFAGTVNEKGSFEFEVTANRGNTTLARIIKSVQEAQGQRAPTQRFVDSFARYYTPVVVILALLVAIVPSLLFSQPFTPWLYKALVMLVIACPCALVISTPVTVVSGLACAAKRGILIKGGVYLEEGRKIKVVALDKTGTLTHGAPVVTEVIPLADVPEAELRRLAASLDAPSEHPVASAIVASWTGELAKVEDFESITGRGVKGRLDGKLYCIGNHRLGHELGLCGPHVEEVLTRLESEAKSVVVISDESGALGVFGVADTLRDTSVQAIRELHDLGVRSLMLTGDNSRTAQAIAKSVGIDDARGDLLPEDKLKAMDDLLREYGEVGMVGDGINDAPALAKATIGFAMGAAGTDTAIETADVALMQDDLRKLPEFLRLSRATGNILKQNIAFAVGIKVVFFALALSGTATLWMAVFADVGASLLVVANGLRLLRFEGGGHS